MASKKTRGSNANKHALTIVIKLGTSSIIHEKTHQPLLSLLSSIVETVVALKNEGHRVVLVSSGAIGALAAIGQGRLIALWDNLFGQLGQPIAQVLLTRGDISDRTRYLNAVNTLSELLSMGVVPIINENDTISVSEIKFGDNDTLSAITSSMLHADYLFLLTDVDSLYTANPRKDPSARAIETVESVSAIRTQVSTATLGSNLGTGGMETKLIAAEIATAAGVATVITSSKDPTTIFRIIDYNTAARIVKARDAAHALLPSTILPPSAPETPTLRTPAREITPSHTPLRTSVENQRTEASPRKPEELPVRPPHTLFIPSPTPLRDVKSWTTHTLYPAGSVIIDAGAHLVLSRRSSGGRLLPAGVLGVKGAFASGQAVRILVKRKIGGMQTETVGVAVDGDTATLVEVSTTSGTASAGPDSPLLLATVLTGNAAAIEDTVALSDELNIQDSEEIQTREEAGTPVPGQSPTGILDMGEDEDGWETIEVGRGLANYNSAEITKIMGQKSSQIVNLLGYADSEYVVENITIKVPP
ncbi:amino acid kinase family [Ceratobasidium sp. AG-Ba]|nr:amino acid kinase family [Ceratobasidium sp. AG-Ba]